MKKMQGAIETIVNNTMLVPFLKGEHGGGKTTFARDLANQWKKSFITMNLSACEAGDFQGIPYLEDGKTKYGRPMFMDYDVIFLDEVDRVKDISVKASLNSLLLDRAINGHKLKEGAIILTAGNYDSDKYETGEFDPSLLDRLAMIDFKLTIPERIEYYKRTLGRDNTFIQFVESKQEVFGLLSPRRIECAAKVHDDEYALEIVVGKELSRAYWNFKTTGLVSFQDLLDGNADASKMSPITRMSLINSLIEHMNTLHEKAAAEVKNCNTFVNGLSAEEKSLYFSKIREMLIQDKVNKDILNKLDGLGMFKNQKAYLKELVN